MNYEQIENRALSTTKAVSSPTHNADEVAIHEEVTRAHGLQTWEMVVISPRLGSRQCSAAVLITSYYIALLAQPTGTVHGPSPIHVC